VSTTHHYIFDIKPDSVYRCAADIGCDRAQLSCSPLANATTGIIYEGTPDFPDKDRWWKIRAL
jgi:acetyl-CoA synthetase